MSDSLRLTPWIVAHQAPLSMGFSRQEYWSGLPCLSPGDLPNAGTEPRSPTLQADSLPCETPGKPLPEKGGMFTTAARILSVDCWWIQGSVCLSTGRGVDTN